MYTCVLWFVAKDADFNDKPMEEALQCNEMMEEPTLVDRSLNIIKGSLEPNFAPQGFIDRTMGAVDALSTFIERSGEHKFDLKNLEPVLKAVSVIQPDIEEIGANLAMAMPEEEEDWHDKEDWGMHQFRVINLVVFCIINFGNG